MNTEPTTAALERDEVILNVKNLGITVRGRDHEVKPVRNVSFEARKNRVLGIVGESGSGKSMTAKAIMRLLPEAAVKISRGSIRYLSRKEEWIEIGSLPEKSREMRRLRGGEISLIFQESLNCLNPVYTVGHQISETIRQHVPQAGRTEARRRARNLLATLGLHPPEKRLKQFPHELSGGMRQRVLIALAIAAKPRVVIADEPTTALDVTLQAQVLRHLKAIQQSEEMSLLLITHDLGLIAEYANDAAVFHAGWTVESGSVDDLFNSPKHPYTQYLLDSTIPVSATKDDLISLETRERTDEINSESGCPYFGACPKRMARCEKECPPAFKTSSEHRVRCWLYEEE